MNIQEYLAEGTFDPKENPIAAQLHAAMARGTLRIETKQVFGSNGEAVITNVDEVLHTLWEQNQNLLRAVALLENQIRDLRGAPAPAADNLVEADPDTTAAVLRGDSRM